METQVEEAVEAWRQVVSFVVFEAPQPRGSKHALVQKNWRGDKSIIWRKPPRAEHDGSGSLRVWGDPMVLMTDDNRDSTAFMKRVARAAREAHVGPPIETPVRLTLRFYFARLKGHYRTGKYSHLLRDDAPHRHTSAPDLSKLTRAMEDAMTGIVYKDDRQICCYGPTGGKWWASQACVGVIVETLDPADDATAAVAAKQEELNW